MLYEVITPNMALDFYKQEPLIRSVFDNSRKIMLEETGKDFFQYIFPGET